jgi:hypothetical protein
MHRPWRHSARPRWLLPAIAIALLTAGWQSGARGHAFGAAPPGAQPNQPRHVALAQATDTPVSLPPAGSGQTPTPTPRVIVVAPPAATTQPTPPVIMTATAPPAVITEPTATATLTPAPTPTPLPTATPSPSPLPASPVRIDFTAEDWRGGYYRGDSQAYGRPWVAVYGAASAYPRATLQFTLDATPDRPATLAITGLDDELTALNPIAVEVNGEPIYSGPSPFLNWDGVGNGADAAWTAARFTIPTGYLRAGRNEIAVANRSPAASFNAPPYVLLADASLDIPGASASERTPVPIVPAALTRFAAADWRGGFYRGDSRFYGRPWVAIYGANSDYPRARLRFELDRQPVGAATLTVAGLDDELAERNPIAIDVNDQRLFTGPSPFLDWDGVGNGENAAWTEVEISIPANLLRPGRNTITMSNLSPTANFNAPPYILLADATLTVPGAQARALTSNQDTN